MLFQSIVCLRLVLTKLCFDFANYVDAYYVKHLQKPQLRRADNFSRTDILSAMHPIIYLHQSVKHVAQEICHQDKSNISC